MKLRTIYLTFFPLFFSHLVFAQAIIYPKPIAGQPGSNATVLAINPSVELGTILGGYPLRNNVEDFLIQDVCVETSGRATSNDPAACPPGTYRRNLLIGEDLPYIKTDSGWGTRFIVSNAFPLLDNRSVRVVMSREFTNANQTATQLSAARDFNEPIDGYDVIEVMGNYVSSVTTKDPGGNILFYNSNCLNEDGWVLFSSNIVRDLMETLNHYLGSSTGGCPSGYSGAHTAWNWSSAPFTYSNGRTLETIQSWHYAGGPDTNPLTAKHIEISFFTREYGPTRWERWETFPACRERVAADGGNPDEVCNAENRRIEHQLAHGCNGPTQINMAGQEWVRLICGEWSYVLPQEMPLHPYHVPTSYNTISTTNLLKSGDFVQLSGWGRFEYPGPTNWIIDSDPTTNNRFVGLNCGPVCSDNSVFQDVSVVAKSQLYPNAIITMGALVRGAPGSVITFAAFPQDPSGAFQPPLYAQFQLQSGDWTPVRMKFHWNFVAQPTQAFRYQVYLGTPGGYNLDEAFFAVLPE